MGGRHQAPRGPRGESSSREARVTARHGRRPPALGQGVVLSFAAGVAVAVAVAGSAAFFALRLPVAAAPAAEPAPILVAAPSPSEEAGEPGRPIDDSVGVVIPDSAPAALRGEPGRPVTSRVGAPVPAASPLPSAKRPTPSLLAGDYLAAYVAGFWPNADVAAASVDTYAGVDYQTLPAYLSGVFSSSPDTGYTVAFVGVHDLNDSPEEFADDLDRLSRDFPSRCVVWVTTHHMDYGFAGLAINELLRARAASAGLRVVSWDTMVRGNPSLVNADGRYPTYTASAALAAAIAAEGASCRSV